MSDNFKLNSLEKSVFLKVVDTLDDLEAKRPNCSTGENVYLHMLDKYEPEFDNLPMGDVEKAVQMRWGSRCYKENSLRTTGAYIKERTRSRASVCPVSTALEPAKQSDLHLGKYRVSSMLSKGDVPKDVSVSDWCLTGDLAQVQRTVCSATGEAWATCLLLSCGLVSSLTLTKTWLQTKKKSLGTPRPRLESYVELLKGC